MDGICADILFFDTGETASDAETSERTEEKSKEEKVYRCSMCGQSIAPAAARIAMDGSSEYTYTNPHGFVFTIGYFRIAPGCAVTGVPTTEYTWFPGYAWRYASCMACGVHLGWEFSSGGGDRFYGLILKRLSEF